MRQAAREHDIVARYGGEEFLLLLPNTSLGAAAEVAEQIRALVEHYEWVTLNPQLRVTISLGVAEQDDDGPDTMIATADRNLYVAKRSGKNRVHF
jgi:diguanylate cyclase (GGDEF)-like protein